MTIEHNSLAASDHELLHLQTELQSEASRVQTEFDLTARLSRVGKPVRVGSAELGLMARRDLDITVTCARLDAETHAEIMRIGAELALQNQVQQVRFRNDTGQWNIDPLYPDGLYLGSPVVR